MFRKTIRTAALFVATAAALCVVSQEVSAQCGGGFNSFGGGGFNRGFGGVSVSVGRSNFGGFNRGVGGFNSFGRSGFNSGFRGGSVIVPSRGFSGGFNSFGRSGFKY